jgi:Glycoside-hydrolase family GH114
VLVRLVASTAIVTAALGCTAAPGSPGASAATTPVTSPTLHSAPLPSSPSPLSTSTRRKPAPRKRVPRPAPIVLPPLGGRFDYQLGGAYTPPAGTAIVVRDRGDAVLRGVYDVCYVNAFQTQPEELAWWQAHHPKVLLRSAGAYVEDPDWPGEVLLDTSTAAKRTELAAVVGSWIAGCAVHGYRAVELDNLDSWTRSGGALTSAGNLAFATLLVRQAHARRLAVAQKNTAELAAQGRRIGFDFAVAEECQVYDECGAYTTAYGRHVLEVEYTDNGLDAFPQACAARGKLISVVLRDRDLVPVGDEGYVYRRC